jgi:transposase-like protein
MLMMNKEHPCGRCRHPEYQVGSTKTSEKRPAFTCTNCGYTWTNGRTGGEYLDRRFAKPCKR